MVQIQLKAHFHLQSPGSTLVGVIKKEKKKTNTQKNNKINHCETKPCTRTGSMDYVSTDLRKSKTITLILNPESAVI